jgi:molybdopterin molybdotransferase
MPPQGLIPVDEARERILALVRPLDAEQAPIDSCIGRALAVDVAARRTLPPWDNSAMDGYAVRAADLATVPATLNVVETIFAGQTPLRTIGHGECARIMTGAPLPKGADAVVMQEKTRAGDARVDILERVAAGASVRRAGEDARAGEPLLARGTPVGVPEAGLLWAQGLRTADVHRRPRVAILSTGDELASVGEEDDGRIVDTNSPSLAAAVRRAGGEPTLLGVAKDRLADVLALVERALPYDVVLSSAGVSVGEKDFVRTAFERAGVEMSFWRIAMRPGKPLAAGHRGSTLVIGLPGNPTSSLVTFELFVRPALRRLLGHTDVAPPRVPGRCAARLEKSAGLTHFIRVVAAWREGGLEATPLVTQSSGALRSVAAATHLMVFPAASERLSPGDPVELLPLSWVA